MADRMQLRRDTAANWTAYNPILLEGEPGIELDTDQWKLGDGVHTWSQLAYRGGECVQQRGQSTTVAMSQKAVTDELNLMAKMGGAYILEHNVPVTTGTIALFRLSVDRAPIELTIDVIENTATYEDSQWLGIKTTRQGVSDGYYNLTDDGSGKFYFRVPDDGVHLETTEFYIYARKCTSAGTLKIKVNTDDGKSALAKTANDNFYSLLAINVNRLNHKNDDYSNTTTARLAVPKQYRYIGQIISYRINGNWIIEQFIGTVVNETAWKSEDAVVRWRTLWFGSAIDAVNSRLDVTNDRIDLLYLLFPKKEGLVEKTDGLYKLINPYEGEYAGAGIRGGHLFESTYAGSLVTSIIPIISGARYKLKTAVRNMFDGVAYYTNIAGTTEYFCGYDVFHTDSGTAEVKEAELTIPSGAKYMRLATFNKDTAWKIEVEYPDGLIEVASAEDIARIDANVSQNAEAIREINSLLPDNGNWEKQEGGVYTLRNFTQNNGSRIKNGSVLEASSASAKITDFIPIEEGKRYRLKTYIGKHFDGIAYYRTASPDLGENYLGHDIFYKPSTDDTYETVEAELTIPSGAAYMRLGTADENIYEIYKYVGGSLKVPVAKKSDVDDIKEVLPKFKGWRKLEGGVYDLRNTQQTVGTRLTNGIAADSAYEGSLITGWIPIEAGKRYKLKTVIRSVFDGVAYYSDTAESAYLGNDVFHKDNSSPEVMEAILTIPENARYMRCATFNSSTAYELSEYKNHYLPVASEEYVQEQLEEYTPSDAYINQLIDAKTDPIESDIDYLYGVVSAGETPPELAVRYVPTFKLYLGNNILDVTDVTYDPNYWTVDNGIPKYLGGGSRSTTFKFNAATINGARYLADIVTLSSNGAYENLFYLKIGQGETVDTYNGGRTTFGGFIADGGNLEIIPLGVAFDVNSITLKHILSSDSDPDYTETRNLPVDNVDCGNSHRTLIDGKWNVAVGPTGETMAYNVNGSRSVAIGLCALKNWNHGMQNIGIGTFAMANLKSGEHNIAIGSDCFWQVRYAQDNVIIGRSACGHMFSAQEGNDDYTLINNVVIGMTAMGNNRKNSNNCVAVGYHANVYGVPNSVFIGFNARSETNDPDMTNAIAIGYNARATKSNQCVLGNTDVTEFVLGSKKLVFNQDGTVSWTSR